MMTFQPLCSKVVTRNNCTRTEGSLETRLLLQWESCTPKLPVLWHIHWLVVCVCAGAEGFASEGDQEEVRKVERQLKNRFPIGSHVSEQRIVQDFLKQVGRHYLLHCLLFAWLTPSLSVYRTTLSGLSRQ